MFSQSELQTEELAKDLAAQVLELKRQKPLTGTNPFILSLSGPMGSGKTTFFRFFLKHWLELHGHVAPHEIPSPTYNIVKTYAESLPECSVAHFDLYRLKSSVELVEIGFPDLFFSTYRVLVFEWLDRFPELLSEMHSNGAHNSLISLNFQITEKGRRITQHQANPS